MKDINRGRRSCKHSSRIIMVALCAVWCGATWSDAGESRQGELHVLPQGQQWEAKRRAFYHQPQGTRLIPYSWFLALKQKAEPKSFSDSDYLSIFGLLRDTTADRELAPETLPIGFAKTPVKGSPDYLGFNCAFCHTGQINYTDPTTYQLHHIRIDGGPSMQFNARFLKELVEAVKTSLEDPGKRADFVAAIMQGDPYYKTHKPEELLQEVREWLVNISQRARLDSLEWGFGRFDALGNGANLIFAEMYKDRPDNIRAANGPVSIPSIWGSTRYNRMQWNGSVQNSLARGIAEAMSAGAPPDLDLNELLAMDQAVNTLEPPPWPEIFPPIDPDKRDKGKRLYERKCLVCHGDPHANRSEKITIQTTSAETIGTDSLAATNFHTRKVEISDGTYITASAAIKGMTDKLMSAARSSGQIPASATTQNEWQNAPDYVARPLHGIWATPPYLHNGSVPNLYQLLSPVKERAKCFYVDNRQYDPVRVGFAMRRCDFQSRLDDPLSGFELDTMRPGNYNTGHEFAGRPGQPIDYKRPTPCDKPQQASSSLVLGCELSPGERWQLIEYLKSLTLP